MQTDWGDGYVQFIPSKTFCHKLLKPKADVWKTYRLKKQVIYSKKCTSASRSEIGKDMRTVEGWKRTPGPQKAQLTPNLFQLPKKNTSCYAVLDIQ